MAVVGKNPIAEGNFHGFLPVTVKALNSYSKSFTSGDQTKEKKPTATEQKRILWQQMQSLTLNCYGQKIIEQNGLLTSRTKWAKLDTSSNDLIQSRSGKGVAGRKNEGKKSEERK